MPRSHQACDSKIRKGFDNLAFLTKFRTRRKIRVECGTLLAHGLKKFLVGLCPVHLVEQEFHGIDNAQLRQHLA